MSNNEIEKQEKENNNDEENLEFELIYSNDIKKIKELDNNNIYESSTNFSEGIKDTEQSIFNFTPEINLENDKNQKMVNPNFLNNSFISIDTKNYFIKNEQKFSDELNKKLKKKYQNNNLSEQLKELSESIKNKFLLNLFPEIKQDFFNISLHIYKLIDKEYFEKKKIEENLMYFLEGEFKIEKNTILIDIDFIKNCGGILGHIYKRLKKFNIKDKESFLHTIKQVLEQNVKVKKDFDKNFSERINDLKPENLELFYYFKKLRNKYIIAPEIIYLMNLFSPIKKIIIDLNIFSSEDFDNSLYYIFILCILNFPYILINLESIKFSIFNEEVLKNIYETNETQLNNSKEFFSYKKNKLNIKTINNEKLLKKTEESFLNEYKLIDMKRKSIKFKNSDGRKSLPAQGSTEAEKVKEKLFKSNKSLIKINNHEIKNSSSSKKKKRNYIFKRLNIFKKEENFENTSTKNIDNQILEMILITFLFFGAFEKLENLELILFDIYYSEFISYFKEKIKIKIENFHIFDLVYNKLIELKSLKLEINPFDLITFDKILNILYNSNASTIKLSLFATEYIYSSPLLYKIYCQNIKSKLMKENINNNIQIFNDEFYKRIYPHFKKDLNSLFEILKNKTLSEIGINLNIPPQIISDEKYIIIIIKFIINIFILYYDNKESKTRELSIVSPSLVINGKKYLFFDEFLLNNNINNENLLILDIRLKLYNIKNLHKFIPQNLRILNIADLDIFSLKYFVDNITDYKFIKNSSLQQLTIRINNTIQKFDEEIKLIFAKLFNINIQNLLIYLYTNIIIELEDYKAIIDLLQSNWIYCYCLSFNIESRPIIKKNYSLTKKIKYIIPKEPEYSKMTKILDMLAGTVEKEEKKPALFSFINWCLKNAINKANKSKKVDFYTYKKISSNIFEYLYITNTPEVKFYEKDV